MEHFCIILCFYFLFFQFSLQGKICDDIIKTSKTEGELIKGIDNNIKVLVNESKECIEKLLLTSHYKALEHFVEELNERGIKFREILSNSIVNIQKEFENIQNEFSNINKEKLIKSPAFQWAQSMEKVYIEVKFASRHDSPGCLEINNVDLSLKNDKILLTGECTIDENIIQYNLDIELFDEIDTQYKDLSPTSNGRYQLVLRKKETKYWTRLLKDENDIRDNMKVWFEMKAKFEGELSDYEKKEDLDEDKSFEEIERELREEKKKKKKNKKKGKKSKKSEKKTEL